MILIINSIYKCFLKSILNNFLFGHMIKYHEITKILNLVKEFYYILKWKFKIFFYFNYSYFSLFFIFLLGTSKSFKIQFENK